MPFVPPLHSTPCNKLGHVRPRAHRRRLDGFPGVQALRLAQLLEEEDDWSANITDVLATFEEQTGRATLYSIVFF